MPFAFQFDIKRKAEIKFANARRNARHSLSASLRLIQMRAFGFFHLKFPNIANSGLDLGGAHSDNPSCALCLRIKPCAAAGALRLPVKQVCLYVLHLKRRLSLSLSPYCLRAQICNADVVCSLSVKRAPEKGMDNQPQAKLGLYTPLSAIKLKTGGQTSDLLGNVHEINPLIF